MNAIIMVLGVLGQGYCGPGGCASLPTTRLVSVEVLAGDGVGSGTILRATDRRALVLTAAHMVRGRQSIRIRARDGFTYGGRLLGRAQGADLAALEIRTPAVLWTRIRAEHPRIVSGQAWELQIAPRPPSRVVVYGFGGEIRRGLSLRVGSLLNPSADLEGEATYALIPELGDSGGGAWSSDGFFAGVLSARDGLNQSTSTRAYIVGPTAVRAFLRQDCCLLRLAGMALLGRRAANRSSLDVSVATQLADPPVTTRVIPPPDELAVTPFEQNPPIPPTAETLPARPRLREATTPDVAPPDLSVVPLPVTNSVIVHQYNGRNGDLAQMRADIADIQAKMRAGITFAIPQLNGLQKRRTVRLGESIGLEMNPQGPAMEAIPTAAPNQ